MHSIIICKLIYNLQFTYSRIASLITHVNILYLKGSKHDQEIGNEFNALYEKIIIKKKYFRKYSNICINSASLSPNYNNLPQHILHKMEYHFTFCKDYKSTIMKYCQPSSFAAFFPPVYVSPVQLLF